MPISALPTPPSRQDPANFNDRADAFLGALPLFQSEANTLQTDVNAKQSQANISAINAAASELAASNTASATIWVSGTTYSVGQNRFSPINFLTYRRKTAGAGTTDPSLDATNWQLLTGLGNTTLEAVYPVGSVYINATNATSPATLFGFGTWTAFGAGRVPVGFNGADPLFDTAEETGGSKDSIVVSHTHTFSGTSGSTGVGLTLGPYGSPPKQVDDTVTGASGWDTRSSDHTHSFSGSTDNTGSSGTNANLQPYITVYMWKRVS